MFKKVFAEVMNFVIFGQLEQMLLQNPMQIAVRRVQKTQKDPDVAFQRLRPMTWMMEAR